VSFLVDTNVISELRKGGRAHAGVREWFSSLEDDEIFLSVIVIGEIRRGIELVRRRDARGASSLDRWLRGVVAAHEDRILPVTSRIADVWGRLNVPDPIPVVDGLLAATARVHDLTVATRNVRDIERTGVAFFNPFDQR
jgi:predicted nucleic acid-binding protein